MQWPYLKFKSNNAYTMAADTLTQKEQKVTLISPLVKDGETLSRELHVTPLRKGEIAVYKLIDADKDDPSIVDEKGKPRKRTPGYTHCGEKKIYDPIQQKTITIMNKTKKRKTKSSFGEIITETPEPVIFRSHSPSKQVRHDEPETYAFMERSPENASNPFAPPGKKKFYRVDNQKKISKDLELDMFLIEALNWVKDAKLDELKVCAVKVNEIRAGSKIKVEWKDDESSIAIDTLKRELIAVAKTDPILIMKGSNNTKAKMKLQVQDAERYSLIMFADGEKIKAVDGKFRQWFFNDDNLSTICTVDVGRNKYDALLEFFEKDKDGGKVYEKMIHTLQKIFERRS
jgi:hypothetical protein